MAEALVHSIGQHYQQNEALSTALIKNMAKIKNVVFDLGGGFDRMGPTLPLSKDAAG